MSNTFSIELSINVVHIFISACPNVPFSIQPGYFGKEAKISVFVSTRKPTAVYSFSLTQSDHCLWMQADAFNSSATNSDGSYGKCKAIYTGE